MTPRALAPAVVSALLCSFASAQLVAEDFGMANTHAWGVSAANVAAHLASGGHPGGCIELTVASGGSGLPATTVFPTAAGHPWRGNFRALNIGGFRFDREVVSGGSNFGTFPHVLLGNDNGTAGNFQDDAWVWVRTSDVFQFGAQPWVTVSTPIPSGDLVLPANWGAAALPQNPLAGTPDPDALWNLVIQDVDYVGIPMATPWNGASWFGNHVLRLDNFELEGSGFGTPYCAPAVANSTGAGGALIATGSPQVSANLAALSATSLPQNSFGYFLTSRSQGFVVGPGGSAGNLCLSGSIGRFVGPGQIQNSGALGAITLPLNLAALPQPFGAVPAVAGETWNFQAWYRDAVGGTPTSNFTHGLSVTWQ